MDYTDYSPFFDNPELNDLFNPPPVSFNDANPPVDVNLFQRPIDFETTSLQSVSSIVEPSQNISGRSSSRSLGQVPELLGTQLTQMNISSDFIEALTAISRCPSSAPASKESFCRRFPLWKAPITSIIDLALSFVYHQQEIVLSVNDLELHSTIVSHTCRATMAIIKHECAKNSSFEAEGASKYSTFVALSMIFSRSF